MNIFSGWQYQESPPTVQCAVEKALIKATKLQRKDLQLVGASRTDAGVHAWGQVKSCFFSAISSFNSQLLDWNFIICWDCRLHILLHRLITTTWIEFTQL